MVVLTPVHPHPELCFLEANNLNLGGVSSKKNGFIILFSVYIFILLAFWMGNCVSEEKLRG